MKSVLVFIPSNLPHDKAGYIYGKVLYDYESDSKKFYVMNIEPNNIDGGGFKLRTDFIGYYCNTTVCNTEYEKKSSDWIHLSLQPLKDHKSTDRDYCLKYVTVDSKKVNCNSYNTVFIVYDQIALVKAELFKKQSYSGNHFLELKEILERKMIEDQAKNRNYFNTLKEILLMYIVWFFMYPVIYCCKLTNTLLIVLKYSTLGLHLNGWLENIKWTLMKIMDQRKFGVNTMNHVLATILDVTLGILALQLLLHVIDGLPPSQILLDNAEKVVEFLKSLVNWLMGAPAGLKLNHAFNKTLGRFFLYHIHLWWTFLVFIKPVMDFFFEVLLLFGRLGITFQIAIAADILALVSFHTYCIYVYAARLFNIQIRGLTALFRLFLGKKQNPLRERVDSCQYKADQLFVGTLLFTILLFLMPTTWVYYTVFTSLRLVLIGVGGILTRLRFYFQIIPIYTFFCWLFGSKRINSSAKLVMKSKHDDGSITLLMTTVVSPWSDTWAQCIPDTIKHTPPIEWAMIVKNIFWGQLLYPL
ncbi:hypothetical protein PV327_008456 [Microctonus hyperodae]|uniref:Phosphatidylinositol N-acetylglucosaminyltransferase subunit Q n=1 Tax=Microctonus hyperodae TaxID=165561 RepID=A0AA39F388_MICHY|nr:hypothetical protein PV327_008456 [Microctonus hyperodae]